MIMPPRGPRRAPPLEAHSYTASVAMTVSSLFKAGRVIFAGGVMGTVPLLLKLKEDPRGLPRLSERLGDAVRTNSEALFGSMAPDSDDDYSRGIAVDATA